MGINISMLKLRLLSSPSQTLLMLGFEPEYAVTRIKHIKFFIGKRILYMSLDYFIRSTFQFHIFLKKYRMAHFVQNDWL